MLDVFASNFITFSLILGLALQLVIGNVFDKKLERNFKIALFLTSALVICDILDVYLSGFPTLNNWRYVTSIFGYLIRPSVLAIIVCLLFGDWNKYFNKLIWLPIIIDGILLFSTPFTHIIFYFDENNVFYRGPLGYLSHFMGLMYLAILLVLVIFLSKEIGKLEVLTALYISILCIIATILESVFEYRYILSGAMITSITIYYLYLYVKMNNVDVMTGLFNRRSFYYDIEKLTHTNFAVIIIDLNNLKKINDNMGHAYGDKAICSVANALKACATKKFRIYRIGGDEFAVLGIKQDIKDVETYIANVKSEISKTEFGISIGYAMSEDYENFDETFSVADRLMYNDKNINKLKSKSKEL